MSVKKKLTFSFMAISVLVVLMGIIGVSNLIKVNSSLQYITNTNIPQKQLISDSIILMEKSVSSIKTFALSYTKDDQLISSIMNNLNQLEKNLSKISIQDSKTTKKLIKDTKKLKHIINELVTVHNQKIDLYFTHKGKLYNVETFFYHICNDNQQQFLKWYNSNTIKNKRIKKYIDKYAKAYNAGKIAKQKKHSKKIIKTAGRTIAMIENSEKINFDTLIKDSNKVIALLNKIDKEIQEDLSTSQDDILSVVSNGQTFNVIVTILALIIGVFVSIYTSKNILDALEQFQYGLDDFFKFVNKEKKDINEINVTTDDEFGKMAKMLNSNIVKTKNLLEENQNLIDEVVNISHAIDNGHLSKRIQTTTTDVTLSELKQNFNSMLDNLQKHINVILSTFKEFENNNFTRTNKVDCDGEIKSLLSGVNNLSLEISEILKVNMQNGLTLEQSSNLLANKVNDLSNASNNQAASLEETASSLDDITTNIRQNTQNAIQMADYAKEVRSSVQNGQNLANKTSTSMDAINNEVTSINDAITVIDQIAFQTNILSLNAAVEAATAGEAGKGFAVVAQEVRNLATRSAEAAKEIKTLVENATNKANEGKNISDKMIEGYEKLNNNITCTMDLIDQVTNASKEQQTSIEVINNNVSELDKITQENANIASEANNIAKETNDISTAIVKNAEAKEFIGR